MLEIFLKGKYGMWSGGFKFVFLLGFWIRNNLFFDRLVICLCLKFIEGWGEKLLVDRVFEFIIYFFNVLFLILGCVNYCVFFGFFVVFDVGKDKLSENSEVRIG